MNPCNCSSCTNEKCDDHPTNAPFTYRTKHYISNLRTVTEKHGCLSHQDARVTLMKPVIGELKQLIDICPCDLNPIEAYNEAIVLIWEGVK